MTFSGTTAVVPDDYIAIAGVTGTKHVLSINVSTNTCVVDVVADATVSGAAITRPAPVFSNVVPVPNGGTGLASVVAYAPIVGGTTTTGNLQSVASVGAAGQVLTSNGAGALPSFQAVAGGGGGSVTSVAASVPSIFSLAGSPITTTGTLAMTYSGTALPVANGGTGQTTFTDGQLLIGNSTGGTLSKATLTAGTNITITNSAGGILIDASGTTGVAQGANNAFTGANTFGTAVTPIAITAGAANATTPPSGFSYTGGAHTLLTNGSAGAPEVKFNGAQTKQWTGNTAVNNYHFMEILAPTLSSDTAGATFPSSATVYISGAPIGGTNASTSGAIALLINSGNMTLNAGTLTLKGAPSNAVITQSAASSGTSQSLLLTGGAHTNQTASTEITDVNFALARTLQHATGAITTNRSFRIDGPTHSFVAASTMTEADTLAISQPAAGTNATITNRNALRLTGQLLLDPQAAGGSPQDGNVWADSTQQTLSTRSMGLTTPLIGSIFTATASATCTTTTTETSILGTGVGTKTLPANYLVAGKTIRVVVKGIFSNAAAETLRIRVKAGSTILLDTTATTVSGTYTNAMFQAGGSFVCRTTGAAGTVIGSGSLSYVSGATASSVPMVNTTTTTLDTTAAQTLDVMATWGSASATDTISGQMVTIESVN